MNDVAIGFQYHSFQATDGRRFGGGASSLAVTFKYVNWRDEEHIYMITLESVEWCRCGPEGRLDDAPYNWVLHGQTLQRDGERREVGRRTFLLNKIQDLEVVL